MRADTRTAWASGTVHGPWAFVLFADGVWSAVWLHALTGLGQGGMDTPALALINEHVDRPRGRPGARSPPG